jgi:putative oxidoreductase
MDSALLVGRLLLLGLFVYSGVGKLADISGTAAYIASKGLPMGSMLAVAAGVTEVIAGLAAAIGWQTRIAAGVLLLFTAAATVLFHDFWNLPAGQDQTNQMIHALKNVSIIGGLMILAAAGAGRFSLDAGRPK